VIMIDTFSINCPVSDENSAGQIGLALAALHELSEATGTLVIPAHHTGKEQDRGMRGSTRIHAEVDAVLLARECKTKLELKLDKCRDAPEGTARGFELEPVEVCDGERWCYVKPTEPPEIAKAETAGRSSRLLNFSAADSFERI
jgi:hypothetical protein